MCGLVRLGAPTASTQRPMHAAAPRALSGAPLALRKTAPVAGAACREGRPRRLEVAAQRRRRGCAEQELPLLVALAGDAQPAALEVDAVDGEPGELADAHAGRVEQLEHRRVATGERLVPARHPARRGDERSASSTESTRGSRDGRRGARTPARGSISIRPWRSAWR